MESFSPDHPYLPRIGITIGDVAGIGPEIVLKAIAEGGVGSFCIPVVIGDGTQISRVAEEIGLDISFLKIGPDQQIPDKAGMPILYDMGNLKENIGYGEESALAGKASGEFIEAAAKLCLSGKLDAVSTAPISKRSLQMGGYSFQGHTEFLASLTETTEFAMSFFAGGLRVVLLSTHLPLAEAIKLVKKDKVVGLVKFVNEALERMLKKRVKIALAGLNPHASEGGMFGREEADELEPAVMECRRVFGIDVSGPYSPDTIFLRAFRGEFDAVVSCYHDQATIAVKCLSFGESVNVTLGLPVIRTSVDHGTAYDIAGKNMAEWGSMKEAIRLAAELALKNKLDKC